MTTGADLFVEALESYGVTRLFGNPGTTELPLMQAIGDSDVEYVLGLHEDVAVAAASGYATSRRYDSHRESGVLPLGVVNLHLAGGLGHGLGNLLNADFSGAPLLVTAGNHHRDFQQEEPILSGDLVSLAEQYTKWAAEVKDVAALPTMVRRAVRTALTPPTGPVFLALPVDVQQAETDQGPQRLGPIPTAGRGDSAAIDDAARVVAEAREPVVVLGDEVARSGGVDSAVEFAEAAGARVHGEILAGEVNFPSEHEQWRGPLSTRAGYTATAMDTDTLVFVGCSTNTTVSRPTEPLVPDDATCVHVTNDGWELGKHAPADVAVLGDPAQVLSELADSVREAVDEDERARRLDAVRAWGAEGNEPPDVADGRSTKHGLARALARVAPEAVVVDEGITASPALHSTFPFEPTQLVGEKGGSLGFGVGAAAGVALAEREAGRDRSVVAYVGDGSYLYYPQAIYTAVRYGLDLTVVVPDNRNYRILKENTALLMGGEPDDYEYEGVDFDPPADLVASAESYGALGLRVDDPAELDATLERALGHDGPALVDVPVTDDG
ncbi:acetolactate synthase [Salinigranum rubrum]|uniref:Acetolactate synthase n=1 Tax=Salinigranum rubrum TaxID=755307 RepID=A0A2I8VK09_9EURY|nr:thiamine pyrophosphate-binding protein [Salinigranum rubrum]AUV82266.1 acetolactate synthase [Salinigranum rubrum]